MESAKHPIDPSSPLKKMDENIFQLAVPLPYVNKEINSYLIKGNNGFTVIDTGDYTKEAKDLWEKLISEGLVIEKIVITHAHPDHFGLCQWFQEKYQIPIVVSKRTYEKLQDYKKTAELLKKSANFFQRHGFPKIPTEGINFNETPYQFEPNDIFEIEEHIQLGNEMYETIYTPGHSEDHVCFYHQTKRILIVADQVLLGVSPVVGVFREEDGNPLKDYLQSLKKLKTYETKIALTGHGDVIYDLNKRIDEIIANHEHRLKQIIDLVKDKGKTVCQLTMEIYGDIPLQKIINPFGATLARCIYLESMGIITSKIVNDTIVYTVS